MYEKSVQYFEEYCANVSAIYHADYEKSMELRKKIVSYCRISETVFDCAINFVFIAGSYKKMGKMASAKKFYEEAIEMLIPILPKDKKSDWHYIFATATLERFILDTFSGKKYLEYAIEAWNWLIEYMPKEEYYKKQYEKCKKMYQRCYSK